MYAIVQIGGHQYKVEKSQKLFVNRLDTEAGKTVDFDQVMLIENGGSVVVGAPVIEGALVKAKVIDHLKGDKVIIFKKKRRKGYEKKNGHRQYITRIEVQEIVEKGGVAAKKEAAPVKSETPKASKSTAADDLKKIEGIGPKIAEILNAGGINTFADLASASVDKIKELLVAAGDRYKMHDPATWPKQAKLAADGQWDELKTLQDQLQGGK